MTFHFRHMSDPSTTRAASCVQSWYRYNAVLFSAGSQFNAVKIASHDLFLQREHRICRDSAGSRCSAGVIAQQGNPLKEEPRVYQLFRIPGTYSTCFTLAFQMGQQTRRHLACEQHEWSHLIIERDFHRAIVSKSKHGATKKTTLTNRQWAAGIVRPILRQKIESAM